MNALQFKVGKTYQTRRALLMRSTEHENVARAY